VHLALVVIPDFAARLRENGFDRQQVAHLLRLEDAALGIDERNALPSKHKARLELDRRQVIADLT
jgi:transcriptional regulator